MFGLARTVRCETWFVQLDCASPSPVYEIPTASRGPFFTNVGRFVVFRSTDGAFLSRSERRQFRSERRRCREPTAVRRPSNGGCRLSRGFAFPPPCEKLPSPSLKAPMAAIFPVRRAESAGRFNLRRHRAGVRRSTFQAVGARSCGWASR